MYRRTRALALAGATFAATLGWLSRPAQACGGFFCSAQQPVNQAAERIVFADNGDGTVTAIIQILYQGPSQNFSWLLPISTVPEPGQLQVASDIAFTRLQNATNPLYALTTRTEGTCRSIDLVVDLAPVAETCDDNPLLAGCQVAPGSVTVDASGVIGQFEWDVISVDSAEPDPATPARDWLVQSGYDVTPEASALIGPYLADGMHLLALKLTKGSDVGSIRPLQLTYAADAPMIPIKLTAVAANRDMGVMTWVLSSSRAVPFNYSALELNEARIDWFTGASNYDQVVTEAADDAGGQGFVTEFAGPSSQLAEVVWSAAEEADWQSVRNGTYQSFAELFQRVAARYQSFSGFWDALRDVVVVPGGIAFDDFKSCPSCYRVEFSPSKLFEALDSDVIDPMRRVQQLFDRVPYTTRLYTTLSAADMTLDPLFIFNPDLPELSNVHTAERVIECDPSRSEADSPWRIELPQGSVLRGNSRTLGMWPSATAEQPANLRVRTLSRSGAGRLVEDNMDAIDAQLATYNADFVAAPRASGPGAIVAEPGSAGGGGFCDLAPGRPARGALPGLALSVLASLAVARRRRRLIQGARS